MLEYLLLCTATVAAIAASAILFKEFLKRRGRIAVEGSADNGTVTRAARTCTSPQVEESAASSGYDYEVFLSFRGKDTRAGFTNFLYTSMIDAGVRVYKDDKELRKGEKFGPELLQAIDQSKISIPIFSKGYASSVWCLKELVHMVECQKNGRQEIMPIFYDVAPSEVRYQTGVYGEAFLTHEDKNRYDEDTMRQWKAALTAVGELDGWDLQSMPNREEGEIAKTITNKVFNELKKAYLVVSDNLVNVDHHVEKIMEEIGAQTTETRIIGIHGMGGIGKTTIAKIIYNQLSNNFKHCCFLSNIRETSKLKGIECLQHQLISEILKTKWMDIRNIDEGINIIRGRLSNKKVLLLLDDVEEKDHMDALVGKHDWFGEGSKLIITTRRKDVLCVQEVDWRYELTGMDPYQSLQLFSKHAFRRDSPLAEYINQSKKVIHIARGLPLALEVIGSLLSGKNKEMWDATLKMLESIPHDKVQNKLKISYDALDDRQKHIFLDIACLFIGYDKDILVHFWDESKFFPKVALEVLQNVSLIKINEDNEVWMHDQLRDLGREIVRRESKMTIEKQSRIWNPTEALDVLRTHKGKKEVEALRLKFDRQHRFTYKDLKSLSNLTFLEVDGLKENFRAEKTLVWHTWPSNLLPTNVFQKNSNLLPQLRWLSWHNIPPTFKITNFSMENMVFLDLSRSEITHDWKGWSHMKVMKNLKVLNLTRCQRLKRTPNFSSHSNLERLILWVCLNIVEIDTSICKLKRLVSLDVTKCQNLQMLPDKLGRDLVSLEYLSLEGCRSLERLPDTIGDLESLIELDITNTRIEELPHSIGKLKNLKVVKMWDSEISKIPDDFWTIEKLEKIVGNCAGSYTAHVNIGNYIYRNQSMRILRLTCAHIYALPRLPESLIELQLSELYMDTFPNLSNLTNLKELYLSFGRPNYDGLMEDPIPRWMGNLSKLESLALRFDCVTTSPTNLSFPPQLKALRLRCSNLRCLPRLPSSLSSLSLEHCDSLCLMELSNLKKLSSLHISSAAITKIQGLGCLENLRDLQLDWLGQVKILPDLSNLNKLRSLRVGHCDNLVEIQGELPQFLDRLRICFCVSLQKLPGLSNLMGQQDVELEYCRKLNVETILGFVQKNPQDLQLRGFEQLQILPDLSNSNELRHLQVRSCGNLVEIQGELPQSLEELEIYSCESLQKLPDLSGLKGLQKVDIEDCKKLNGEAILGFARRSRSNFWENLQYLWLSGLGQVEILPNFSNSNKLRSLRLRNCDDLVEIQGDLPQSLEELEISSCESLQKLPDLSSLKGLQKVFIDDCMNLDVKAILGFAKRSLLDPRPRIVPSRSNS